MKDVAESLEGRNRHNHKREGESAGEAERGKESGPSSRRDERTAQQAWLRLWLWLRSRRCRDATDGQLNGRHSAPSASR